MHMLNLGEVILDHGSTGHCGVPTTTEGNQLLFWRDDSFVLRWPVGIFGT